jgi:hypothetical protein
MNSVPSGLKNSLGFELTKAAGNASTSGNAKQIADLMGTFLGSLLKSLWGNS